MPRMHADEVHADEDVVRRLVAAQFPGLARLPVERVPWYGTDNTLYRLGDELVARLPRRAKNVVALEKELEWLPRLAPLLPLAVSEPVAVGEPGAGYPLRWAIYRWLPGAPATDAAPTDPTQAADDVAALVLALQRVDAADAPSPGAHNAFRGVPLSERDEAARAAIRTLAGRIDADAVGAAWEDALAAPDWAGAPVFLHGDLDARNLLVADGRIHAIVDWGTLGAGDPACDVMVAWKLFGRDGRERFRTALGVDDPTWTRARGWVVSQAVIALAYYTLETNPALVGEAERWLAGALEDG